MMQIQNNQERILRLKDVMEITQLSRSTIYSRINEGTFPKQISLGGRARGWVSSEVYSWISNRVKESRNL